MRRYIKHGLCLLLLSSAFPVLPYAAMPVLAIDGTAQNQQTHNNQESSSQSSSIESRVNPFDTEDPVEVILANGKDVIEVLQIVPVYGKISTASLKLPGGISLKDGLDEYVLEKDQNTLKLEASSLYTPTTVNITFMENGQEAGKTTVIRAVPADADQNIQFELSQDEIPEGFVLQDQDAVFTAAYGKTTDLEIEVLPKQETRPVEVQFVLPAQQDQEEKTVIGARTIQVPADEDQIGIRVADILPPSLMAAQDQDAEILLDPDQESAEVLVQIKPEFGLLHVIYKNGEEELGSAYYTVPMDGDNESICLNLINLQLPEGTGADGFSQMAEVYAGKITEAVLSVTKDIVPTNVVFEFFNGEEKVGDQTISRYLPSLNGYVSFSVSELSIPQGYQLKESARQFPMSLEYGEEVTRQVEVEPVVSHALVSYILEDGSVIETQKVSSPEGILKEEDLKLPENYALKAAWKPAEYTDNQRIDVSVVRTEDAKKDPSVFNITYKDSQGNTAGTQTKSVEAEKEYAILTEDQLDLPEGYELAEPFEEISAPAGESRSLTCGVLPNISANISQEASFEVVYQDENGDVVGKQNIILTGSGEITLEEKSLKLPEGYKLKDPFTPVKSEGTSEQKVTLTVVKASSEEGEKKEAVFKIAYKDPEGNTISTETVKFSGTSGSASLEQSSLKLPEGYKIKGTYTAPTTEYGKQISLEIKVEKDPDYKPSSSSSEKAQAVLEVYYYVQDGSDHKTVKKETFKSEEEGEKGEEYIFIKDQTFHIKVPNGYVLVNDDVPNKVSVDYGFSGKLEVQVKLSNVSTSVSSNRSTMSTLFVMSLAGFAGLWYMKKRDLAFELSSLGLFSHDDPAPENNEEEFTEMVLSDENTPTSYMMTIHSSQEANDQEDEEIDFNNLMDLFTGKNNAKDSDDSQNKEA